jgi:hypothetical protein
MIPVAVCLGASDAPVPDTVHSAFMKSEHIDAKSSNVSQLLMGVWIAGDGVWSDESRWIDGVIPGIGQGPEQASIDGGDNHASTVIGDVSIRLLSLQIDKGDRLELMDDLVLTLGQPDANTLVFNAGQLGVTASMLTSEVRLQPDATVVLNGGGEVILNHEDLAKFSASTGEETLINIDNTFSGCGVVGEGLDVFENQGVVIANRRNKTLTVRSGGSGRLINQGVLWASAQGKLILEAYDIENIDGMILAQNRGRIELRDVSISGGLLISESDGRFFQSAAPVRLDNLTLAAQYELGRQDLYLSGSIINEGLLLATEEDTKQLAPRASRILVPSGESLELHGTGSIELDGGEFTAEFSPSGSLLHNRSGHTLCGHGEIGMDHLSLVNEGVIRADAEDPLIIDPVDAKAVVNQNLLQATGEGGLILVGGAYTNNGTVEVRPGSRLIFGADAEVTNTTGAELNGGVWNIFADETGDAMLLIATAALVGNDADVTFSGANASFPSFNSVYRNGGRLTLLNGAEFQTSSWFNNTGILTLSLDSSMSVRGNFNQSSGGTLRIIGMNEDRVDSGPLSVHGEMHLSGVLSLAFESAALPEVGTELHLIEADSFTGAFTEVVGPGEFEAEVVDGDLVVTVMSLCPYDSDGDGRVGLSDLEMVMSSWGPCPCEPLPCLMDMDGDGAIGLIELNGILSAWGDCGG